MSELCFPPNARIIPLRLDDLAILCPAWAALFAAKKERVS